jgi:hypothetical protein
MCISTRPPKYCLEHSLKAQNLLMIEFERSLKVGCRGEIRRTAAPTLSKAHARRDETEASHLSNVKEQEGHHEREQAGGFSEGETQDGVLEELTTEGRVAGDTLDEATEHGSDTNTSTGEANGGKTSTLDLSSGDNGGGSGLGDDATGLDHVAAEVAGDGGASSVAENKAVLGQRALEARGACGRKQGQLPSRWPLTPIDAN